ncbi:hypothetical protein JYT28_01740, partial [Desulfobulbus sp. AH-315-M07]|nr:hypothetical protein [Desulfobulbus sp. AH-315-M07]
DATVTPDGRVHVTFEVGISRKKAWGGAIQYASFEPQWIDKTLGAAEDPPFSESIYAAYQNVRAPLEEWMHRAD